MPDLSSKRVVGHNRRLLACLAVSVFEIHDQFLTFLTCCIFLFWINSPRLLAKFLKYLEVYLVLVSSSRNESCIVGYSTKYALQTNHLPLLPKAELRYLAYLIVELISE